MPPFSDSSSDSSSSDSSSNSAAPKSNHNVSSGASSTVAGVTDGLHTQPAAALTHHEYAQGEYLIDPHRKSSSSSSSSSDDDYLNDRLPASGVYYENNNSGKSSPDDDEDDPYKRSSGQPARPKHPAGSVALGMASRVATAASRKAQPTSSAVKKQK